MLQYDPRYQMSFIKLSNLNVWFIYLNLQVPKFDLLTWKCEKCHEFKNKQIPVTKLKMHKLLPT